MAARPMTDRRIYSRLEPSCLYPDDKEVGLLLLGKARAHLWPVIAKVEERAGLPLVSLQYGGRFWPAVLEFYLRRHRLIEAQSQPAADDREGENFTGPTLAEKKAARAAAKATREAAAAAKARAKRSITD